MVQILFSLQYVAFFPSDYRNCTERDGVEVEVVVIFKFSAEGIPPNGISIIRMHFFLIVIIQAIAVTFS